MAPVNSAQLYRPSKLQLSCELVSPTSTCQTSTMKEILYVKVNGCVGVFVFGFFGDGESYIVKKSLSKINPNITQICISPIKRTTRKIRNLAMQSFVQRQSTKL